MMKPNYKEKYRNMKIKLNLFNDLKLIAQKEKTEVEQYIRTVLVRGVNSAKKFHNIQSEAYLNTMKEE